MLAEGFNFCEGFEENSEKLAQGLYLFINDLYNFKCILISPCPPLKCILISPCPPLNIKIKICNKMCFLIVLQKTGLQTVKSTCKNLYLGYS